MVDHRARRQDRHDQGLRCPYDDHRAVHLGHVRQVQQGRYPADQSSAWASSPGWAAACQERLNDHQALESGQQAVGVR